MFIKFLAKKFFNFFGLEIKRTAKKRDKNMPTLPRKKMLEALEHLRSLGFFPKTVIDVGAAFGTMDLLETFPKAEHILLEPLIEYEPFLKKLQQQYNIKYIFAGAGKRNEKLTINVHPDLQGSSLYNETDGKDADGIPREISIITLDELIPKYNITNDVLLKVDVQGAELDVLDGGNNFPNFCEVIILEISFFKFLKNAPEFYDIIYYMKQKGFVAYDIFDGTNRPLDNALGQRDILFVKENGRFRRSHHWARR